MPRSQCRMISVMRGCERDVSARITWSTSPRSMNFSRSPTAPRIRSGGMAGSDAASPVAQEAGDAAAQPGLELERLLEPRRHGVGADDQHAVDFLAVARPVQFQPEQDVALQDHQEGGREKGQDRHDAGERRLGADDERQGRGQQDAPAARPDQARDLVLEAAGLRAPVQLQGAENEQAQQRGHAPAVHVHRRGGRPSPTSGIQPLSKRTHTASMKPAKKAAASAATASRLHPASNVSRVRMGQWVIRYWVI